MRVPTANETTESVRRAHRALVELKQRQAIDERRAADETRERDAELARWHTEDTDTTTNHRSDDRSDGRDETDARSATGVNDTDDSDELVSVLEVGIPDDY